jgi:benzoyl-CoA reductase/2-hydroxyglutaryl-CoA dehydratase subunit BcrC/BadD/HgdB
VEIIFAAGLTPIDLNNLFIRSPEPEKCLTQAESAGFSHNVCAWIKGIYASVLNHHIKQIIAVTGGDCSNTIALSEILARKGVQVIPFDYPLDQDRDDLFKRMDAMRRSFSVTWDAVHAVKSRLDRVRRQLRELDRLTFEENVVTGAENHRFLVGSSDFASDPDTYEAELDAFLKKAKKRKPKIGEIRLGLLGVPSIFDDLFDHLESLGGRVVFNEVPRQFSMPFETDDIIEQYLEYTYPYGMGPRMADISHAIQTRNLDGLIHYTQTFCFRQLYDIVLRETVSIPILTLEGDRPGRVDGRTATRIETFLEMLKQRKCR